MDLTSPETDFNSPEMDFKSPEMDFKSPEMDFTSPETDFTFFIFEVHFRWVKSIFNGYLQMDLTFSKHSIFDRLHTPEVYYKISFNLYKFSTTPGESHCEMISSDEFSDLELDEEGDDGCQKRKVKTD